MKIKISAFLRSNPTRNSSSLSDGIIFIGLAFNVIFFWGRNVLFFVGIKFIYYSLVSSICFFCKHIIQTELLSLREKKTEKNIEK